jgi:hypothetical protein
MMKASGHEHEIVQENSAKFGKFSDKVKFKIFLIYYLI